MKKYMLIALLPVMFQSEIYGTTKNLNSMIETELQVARESMRLRTDLDLEKIVNALISHAKIGNGPYNNARIQLAAIRNILEQKRNEQYDTTWSKFLWAFGKYPDFVVTDIDPAIRMVKEADRSIYITKMSQYASDAAYVGGTVAVGAVLISAGAGLAWFIANYGKKEVPMATEVHSTSNSHKTHHTAQPHPTAPKKSSSDEDSDDEWSNTEYGSNPFE